MSKFGFSTCQEISSACVNPYLEILRDIPMLEWKKKNWKSSKYFFMPPVKWSRKCIYKGIFGFLPKTYFRRGCASDDFVDLIIFTDLFHWEVWEDADFLMSHQSKFLTSFSPHEKCFMKILVYLYGESEFIRTSKNKFSCVVLIKLFSFHRNARF